MGKKIKFLLFGLILIAISGVFIYGISEIRTLRQQYEELFRKHYMIFTPEAPSNAEFAGEKVPLEMLDIREAFEREILANTFMHTSTILLFKRANRWFPVIEPILKKNNIPDDFKFLALAESNLNNVISPSGAEGFWQFIKPAGQKYGLEITEEVDERYNVEKATEAACKYFQEAFDLYKNWTLAAASFNRGLDGVTKALEKQHVTNYYDLFLVDETARYIFRILAIKEIYNHPARYGYYLLSKDFHPLIPTYTVTIDTTINDLTDFAFRLKIKYRTLREFNPWIRRYNLPNKNGKSYIFKIPQEPVLLYEKYMKSLPQEETFFHDSLKVSQIH